MRFVWGYETGPCDQLSTSDAETMDEDAGDDDDGNGGDDNDDDDDDDDEEEYDDGYSDEYDEG